MRIGPRVSMVASGSLGASMTGDWDCNVYALRLDGGAVWLIDAGAGHEPERIAAELQADGIERVEAVLVTHGHLDHSGGAHFWRARGAEIWAGPLTAQALEAGDEDAIQLPLARREGIYPADFRYTACPVDRVLQSGETISQAGARLQTIAAPGHAADMICFAVQADGERMLFGADTFFHGGRVARNANPDADDAAYERTLRTLLTVDFGALYPGHGIWSARDGQRHLRAAVAAFDRGAWPLNLTP